MSQYDDAHMQEATPKLETQFMRKLGNTDAELKEACIKRRHSHPGMRYYYENNCRGYSGIPP